MNEIVPEGFRPISRTGPFVDINGPLYEKQTSDSLIIGMKITQRHGNRRGLLHGGMMFTLADLAMGYTAALKGDRLGLTLSITGDFLATAKDGDWIEAHASIDREGKTIIFTRCTLFVDDAPVFRASGIFRVLSGTG